LKQAGKVFLIINRDTGPGRTKYFPFLILAGGTGIFFGSVGYMGKM
jgi:hypothetical protein